MDGIQPAVKTFEKEIPLNDQTRFFAGEISTDLIIRSFTKYFSRPSRHSLLFEALVQSVLALMLLALLFPLLLLTFFGIKMTSKGPAFYLQRRVGKNGVEFDIFKFRTMVQDAEKKSGAVLSWKGDPRITKFGNFLRATHLDELPQLINILKGDMVFIGPRPERRMLIDKFIHDVQGYEQRETVLPGITGLAQISCPYDATPKEKLKYDLYFILNKNSVSLNLYILTGTVKKVFFGKLIRHEQESA